MTLLITQINRLGVVMTADTAESTTVRAPSGKEYTRIRYGARKLFPIEHPDGGVSYWGAGEIYMAEAQTGRMPTDVWLEDFIAREKFQTLEQFAYTLCKYANRLFGPEQRPLLGFQVAGIGREKPGDNLPVFYRISNHDKKGGRRPEFEVEQTVNFPRLSEQSAFFPDGDEALYLEIKKRIESGAALQSRRGDPIPYPVLSGFAEYQAALVRFVSDLYESAGLARTIGGKVTMITMPFGGKLRIDES